MKKRTHSHADAKEAANYLIDNGIQILISRLRAVDLVVCVVAHAQGKKVRLCDDKIEILIEDLGDMLRGARCSYLRSKVLKEGPGNGG